MNNEHFGRHLLLGALISVLPVLIIFKLATIQVDPKLKQDLLIAGKNNTGTNRLVRPVRGQIYDRWGNLLAGNKTVYEIGAELQNVENPDTIALTLNAVLGLDYATIHDLASIPPSKDAVYAVLTDYVTQEQKDRLELLKKQIGDTYNNPKDKERPSLSGLVFISHLVRSYPEKNLASNLLGIVSRENVGYYGVEEKYNNLLAGKARLIWVPFDPNLVEEVPEIPDGVSLILTIDRTIQADIEKILDSSIEETGSKSGTVVVLDPRTGEILAMATTPRIDLNDYLHGLDVFGKGVPFNRGISQSYEPGSVYKVLTMAAGLATGAVTPETKFLDTGSIEIGGTTIVNWNRGAWGWQDMQGCLMHSLNVCLAWVAKKTGVKDFYQYMQAFGIGHMTNVDLAGEMSGRLKLPGDEDWYDADLGTNAFGQGVSATPLQMAMASSAIANDGKIMAPHIVRSMVNKGYQYDMEQLVFGSPLKPETAHTLSNLLARSLETEASDALVTGYRVAGKTGTAEIPTPYGYTSNVTNASFVGWGPVDDPRFLVYVWLEKPTSSIWGSEVASPLFRKIVERLVVDLNLPPDDVRHQLPAK